MKRLFILGLAISLAACGGAARAADPSAAGFWKQVDDAGRVGAWFYFVDKSGVFEGRLVKMFPKPGEPDVPNCLKCEGTQKNAPMLGLVLVKGMKRDGLKYEGGTILDPRDGSVYNAQMQVSPDGQKLFVRGYLGLPILGQTQTWLRLPDNTMATADIPPESASPDVKAPGPPKAPTPAPHKPKP